MHLFRSDAESEGEGGGGGGGIAFNVPSLFFLPLLLLARLRFVVLGIISYEPEMKVMCCGFLGEETTALPRQNMMDIRVKTISRHGPSGSLLGSGAN